MIGAERFGSAPFLYNGKEDFALRGRAESKEKPCR
jgi:hypothetical protein